MHHDEHDDRSGQDREVDDSDRSSDVSADAYELEPAAEPDPDPVDLDPEATCPRCGAPRPEGDPSLPCPSCGFVPTTGEVIDPEGDAPASEPEPDAAPSADEIDRRPLLRSGDPLRWLVAAGVLMVIVIFAMLAGWSSFFQQVDGRFPDATGAGVLDAPRVGLRLEAVLRYVVATGVLLGAGLLAVRITCVFERLPFGDLRTGAARLLLVLAAASLVRLVPLPYPWLQSLLHLVLGAGVVVGLSMLVVGRRDRAVAMFLLAWVLVVLLVIPATRLVSWSLPLW